MAESRRVEALIAAVGPVTAHLSDVDVDRDQLPDGLDERRMPSMPSVASA